MSEHAFVKDRDHLGLLYDIGELAALIRESTDIPNLLERTVTTISAHLKVEVCSIYLYDQETRELVLKATKGLHPEAVEKVRIAVGTGLVGATFESLEPIIVGDAPRDLRFKYFAEAREDAFRSFLAVPIQRGEIRIGVLVVQQSDPNYFDAADVRTLRAVAAQLAGVLENVRLLISLRQREGASGAGAEVGACLHQRPGGLARVCPRGRRRFRPEPRPASGDGRCAPGDGGGLPPRRRRDGQAAR